MATYKLTRKTATSGTTEEVKFPILSIDGLQTALDGKISKTTYEASAELACGSNGMVCLGKFGAYDTNITIELNSTTSTTYHATIVIHSQNVVANGTGGTVGCYVYGDADNHITPLLTVFRPYGSASRQIEVYANLPGWSKNLVHIQGVAISTGGMTDVLTSVSAIPTSISGKTKVTPVNVLTTNFAPKSHQHTKSEITDFPTIPTKTSELTNNSDFATNASVDTKISNLVNSAPEALNTLGELAAALEVHEDAYDALLQTVGSKYDKSGGTITGNVTITNGSSTQAKEPSLKWKTVGANTPYVGFATDQSDGTFLFGSLKGTNYQAGLAIGGGSGNLLWKGARVVTATELGTFVPSCTTSNNGQFLMVVNGKPTWTTVPNAEGVGF